MRLILRMLLAQWKRHWLRTLIVLAALIASVGMVVSVVGGQRVAMARAMAMAARPAHPLGRFDLVVQSGSARDVEALRVRQGVQPPAPPLSEAVLRWLRARPDVRERLECGQFGGESAPPGHPGRAERHRRSVRHRRRRAS